MSTGKVSVMDIPKIQTDSKDDITFLKNNLHGAVTKSLSKHLMPGEVDDATRRAVEAIVNKWVEDTFSMAGGSIQVNGQDYEKAFEQVDEYEPLNESLHKEVQSIQTATEELTLRVTRRRRELPEQIQNLLSDIVRRESQAVDKISFVKDPQEILPELELPNLSHTEVVSADYVKGIGYLSNLKKSVPGNIDKLERAQIVLREVL